MVAFLLVWYQGVCGINILTIFWQDDFKFYNAAGSTPSSFFTFNYLIGNLGTYILRRCGNLAVYFGFLQKNPEKSSCLRRRLPGGYRCGFGAGCFFGAGPKLSSAVHGACKIWVPIIALHLFACGVAN